MADTNRNVNIQVNTTGLESTQASLDSLGLSSTKFGKAISSMKTGFGAMKPAATKAFSSIKVGLISTGLIVFSVAIAAIYSYFQKVESAAQKAKATFAGLGAVVDTIVESALLLVDAFGFLLQGDLESASTSASEAMEGLDGGSLSNAYKDAAKLVDMMWELKQATTASVLANAENRNIIATQLLVSRDLTKSVEERQEAIELAGAAEQAILTTTLDMKQQALDIALLELESTPELQRTEEQRLEVATAKADVLDAQTASLGKQRELQNRINTLIKEGEAAEKAKLKVIEDSAKKSQELQDIIDDISYEEALRSAETFEEQSKIIRAKALKDIEDTFKERNAATLAALGYENRLELESAVTTAGIAAEKAAKISNLRTDYAIKATKIIEETLAVELDRNQIQYDLNLASQDKSLRKEAAARKKHSDEKSNYKALKAKADLKTQTEAYAEEAVAARAKYEGLYTLYNNYYKDYSKNREVAIAQNKAQEAENDAKELAHTEEVAEFKLKLSNSTFVTLLKSEEAKDNALFKQSQESDLKKFNAELNALKLHEEEAKKLRDEFTAIQLANLDEFNAEVSQKKRDAEDVELEATLTKMQEDRDAIADLDVELKESELETEEAAYLLNMERIDTRRTEELAAMKDNKEAQKLINTKYDKAELAETKAHDKAIKQLQKEKNQVAYDSLATAAATLSSFLGDSKKAKIAALTIDKGFAIADIWMNTAVANAKAVDAFPLTFGMPWVGVNTASAALGTAGVLSSAASGIAEINGAATFALGGYIGGQSHSNGGTLLEAEEGEFIVNKRTMSDPDMAASIMDMNSAGNGGSSSGGGLTAAEVAQIVINSIKAIPVIVTESDITNLQKEVSVRESNF